MLVHLTLEKGAWRQLWVAVPCPRCELGLERWSFCLQNRCSLQPSYYFPANKLHFRFDLLICSTVSFVLMEIPSKHTLTETEAHWRTYSILSGPVMYVKSPKKLGPKGLLWLSACFCDQMTKEDILNWGLFQLPCSPKPLTTGQLLPCPHLCVVFN